MKVLIIAFHPRSMTPYSKLYEDVIKNVNVEYDIIFWDRFTNQKLEKIGNEYIIHKICTLGGNKIKKIVPMLYFRHVVKKIIKENNYERIIILNTLPAVLLNDILNKYFLNKYILDVRDYTYEKFDFYKKVVNKLIRNSFCTVISSKGFFKFLEKNPKIYIGHNISNNDKKYNSNDMLKKKNNIVIGFVGVIRYEKENKYLLSSLKNDEKYKYMYVGRSYPDCDLKEYCTKAQIKNVVFKGEFNNNEKNTIYNNIDIINAVYGNSSIEVQTALPNKLYDAIILKKPMIVSKGTYLSEVVEKYKLGISIDFKDNVKEKLENYIKFFDSKQFDDNANLLLDKVNKDQNKIKSEVKKLLKV